jgi:polyketide synthase PksL
MIDLVKYIVSELKSKRLSKADALGLIRQLSPRTPLAPGAAPMHPLLHRNTSDLTQQSFATRFSGEEFFLRDHRIHGKQVLPGVACLEMARAAVSLALPDRPETASLEIRNAVWAQPIVFPEHRDIALALFFAEESAGAGERVELEVYSSDETVHFQGFAQFRERAPPIRHDLAALAARMSKGRLGASGLYAAIARMGIELGPSLQGVTTIHQGEGELLVEIELPDSADESRGDYVLHPSVMDSALQAGMALVMQGSSQADRLPIPFALESLRILGGCERRMFAWVRHSSGSASDSRIVKLDFDLCDADGQVRAQMLGFSSRALDAGTGAGRAQEGKTGCLLAVPAWDAKALADPAAPAAAYAERHVVLCDLPGIDGLKPAQGASLADRYAEVALACFEKLKAILHGKPRGKVLVQVVVPNDAEHLVFMGLAGLLGTAAQENPGLVGQLLFADADFATGAQAILLHEEARGTADAVVRYEGGKRYALRWQTLDAAHEGQGQAQAGLKDNGVYLITGGLGGLGVLFAREILERAPRAKVVLTGRSDLDPGKQAIIDGLNGSGVRVHYRHVDLGDAAQVARTIAGIVEEFGQLNGILHSAGMILDNFILKKSRDEIHQVFAPKVAGTFHLDQATRDIDLDFLVLFSSGVSVSGNAGQADYAAANGFMDGFAAYRNRLGASNARRGITVSINWPLWEEGGMRLDTSSRARLARTTGMQAMTTGNGMQAFHRSLSLGRDQLLVVEGDLERIRRTLHSERVVEVEAAPEPAAVDADSLFAQAEEYLRRQFSEVLKMAPQKVDPCAPLERYGIDSILAMDLTTQLETSFGSLPKTLFFEYQTIRELTGYFVRDYPEKLASLLAPAESRIAAKPVQAPVRDARAPESRPARRLRRRSAAARTGLGTDPIAIVGLSGRYPEADDVEAFWRNLRDGKDCIVEVPKDRWDWRDYYSEDRTAEGRHYSKWGGFISGVDEFDPLFFNIPPVDAELIDPQERLFLQHAWMAVEDAGYTRASLQIAEADGQAGQVGVYVGVMYGEYQLFGAEASLQGKRMGIPVSYASIANRVSYILNLQGPSMTLDTMCSSSLTAIHLACQDLKQGRTHLAIAGGVNVTIHPNKYLILSAGQFISGEGHCQSFGEGGDGYIPGEGVGAVVLKRLRDAERDGNHIYGVIKGSAINHGGKTNGYSVPNPKAQAGVIALALKECGVDARHVSYLEAHGTGTKLGDPIEIAALSQVFRQYTQERQFCAIGSAKSNIGHCESAAGIAGLTKVLLQIKHRMIAPSLHSSALNPHIDFEASPFVVNQTLRAWEQPLIDGKRIPRLAGISSFGAGGSNAHLVVEEYPGKPSQPDGLENAHARVVVPLSARTNDQLKRKVEDLSAFIKTHAGSIDLHALAYTMQVGREPMRERLAFVVDSIAALQAKLEAYGRGDQGIDQCFRDQAGNDTDGISVLSQDDDMAEAIDKWIARKKLPKLADWWARGLELDWRKLHANRKPALISLPTYPFANDRHWVSRAPGRNATSAAVAAVLHPLVHTNTSDFFQQSYTCEFTGDEFFLADHQIGPEDGSKRKILPGVAYLEMARAAVDLALPRRSQGQHLEIRNVAWAQPVTVDGRKRVSIALASNGESIVDFEVLGDDGAAQDQAVHCQGQVEVIDAPRPDRLDVETLMARMTRGAMHASAIYDAFKAMGLHYGPAFRCVATIHKGQDELLAELALPGASNAGKNASFVLHPGLLDSALQASIGLVAGLDGVPDEPSVPFALDSIAIFAACAPRMLAWVRYAEGSRPTNGIRKIDIDLCDLKGELCATLRGLASRALRMDADQDDIGVLIACPEWENAPAVDDADTAAAVYRTHHVVLCDLPLLDPDRLSAAMPGINAERISLAGTENAADRYRLAALACFETLQSILKSAPQEKVLFQLVIGYEADNTLLAGLSGLIDTARLENPKLVGQVVLIERNIDESTLARQLHAARARHGDSLFKSEAGAPRVLRWHPQEVRGTGSVAFRKGGVYLITGGLGGLGLLFAREIFERTEDAVVVLTGRSSLDSDKRATLDALSAELSIPHGRLVYRQLDLAHPHDVESLVTGIVAEFGGLNGVIHSAGMIRDSFIINKTPAEFAQVLEPKVLGTVNLDRATQQIGLDFIVLFSSLASALGNAGQADYAAANGFMDRFAFHRNALVKAGRRHGKTLAIHWPLWQEGGMQLDAETLDLLTAASGMTPLKTVNGMRAFHRGLELGADQVLVIEGRVDRLRRSLQTRHTSTAVEAPVTSATATGADTSKLNEKTQRYLIDQLSSLLKIPSHEVDAKAPLEKYGMDSVLAMKLTSQLERTFGSLSKTLFFEYQTIASLAGYLVKAFPHVVREKTGVPGDGGAGREAVPAPVANRLSKTIPGKMRSAEPAAKAEDEVAIIGVGGNYPQAKGLREFWENLRSGRDCITEIPPDRWDHALFFDPARNQPGKTYSKWGGFLSGVDRFDALFFSISPKEAELIDPQERLFIETVWETIEDAGYSKDAIAQNRVGVYVGAMWGQYELYAGASAGAGVPSSSFASIANRVSYFFNFQGPSLAVDTMCSSSLTAIHLACEEVRKGTIDVAIAGGVNVSIHPSKYLSLSQGNFVSTDGRCRSFGEGGDGYVPGEGVGAVLLKPLSQAVNDGDQIYAVIKAGSINHGGKTNGYTVPNPVAQSDLIVEVLNRAKVDPATIGYIETHGTGTSLGDPIEIAGLVRAFEGAAAQAGRQGKQSCAIGSVKSNIGHLESAAGIAAVTKVLLQFKYQQLVPSLHAERLNPHIDFPNTPFYVQRSLEDWKPREGGPRRAAVSSFGAGGSNGHLILEEFVDTRTPSHRQERPEAFLLSAKTRDALLSYAQKMVELLEETELPLGDIAFTSQVGRTPMQERLVVIASSTSVLKDKLRQWLRESRAGNASKPSAVTADVHEGSTRDARSSAGALIEGDAGRAFLQLTLEQRDLAKLAKLWISGVEIDWAALYRSERPKRVSLPTYPFARERYWIDAPVASGISPVQHEREQMLYCTTEWSPTQPLTAAEDLDAVGPILYLGADDELFAEFRRQNKGTRIVSETDVVSVVEHLQAPGSTPRTFVLSIDQAHGLGEQLDRGVFALHKLCKAVMKHDPKGGVRIVCSQKQGSAENTALHHALAGYLKSLALENPRFSWKVVSVARESVSEDIARALSQELRDAQWRDSEVRYVPEQQGNRITHRRQVKELRRFTPSAIAKAEKAGAVVKQNGVYIVTGGLGGLGCIFSEYLAREYGAKLVLTGRSPLDAGRSRKLDSLQARRARRDDVIYVQADVSDPEQAGAVVREAKRRFSRIDGVIHAAGVHQDALVLNKTQAEMASVLAPKVMGTINLDRATKDEDLDLFVLFSSVAGAFGNPGQCDYAFANGFLDAFAEQRQALVSSGERFGKTLSIDWPLWEEGGMQVSQGMIDLMKKRSGISPLPTDKAIRYWQTFLQSEETQAIALYGDSSKIEAYLWRDASEETSSMRADVGVDIQTEDTKPLHEATENYLKALLSAETRLPVDRMDSQERFESFGVDSMMISRINASLERDLGELPKTLFHEYSTIEELAAYLVRKSAPALTRRFKVPEVARALSSETMAAGKTPATPIPVEGAPIRGSEQDTEAVAIIGVHCHFPGSESMAEFWRNLRQGRDLIDLVPESRWDAHELFDPDPDNAKRGKIYCKWGGFLDDVDKFDAAFFSVSPDDARMIDPQERLFLQSVWSAVEDAGYTRDSLKKRHPKGKSVDAGVFVGVTTNSYHLLTPEASALGNTVSPGSLPWSIANRVSYFFDFQGPSMPIDTACSSSLVAIHFACESLKKKECQVAVAGGVNLYLHPAKYQSLCRRRMLALNGKCRSFGDGDDGFIPGEGVGTLVLKPLAKAVEDRDHIYGVVAASTCEHSGRSNGYSVPNPNSQAMLMEHALNKAGIDPESIGYVEGHGTGTQLGDSLEIVSLTQAFRKRTQKKRYCSLGSVKANIGHAESAAGIAGVAKILLQFKHREIAPTIHSEIVNPSIDFENSPFYLQHSLSPWDSRAGHPRRAMISSFGAGGVNSCLILEEYPAPERDGIAVREDGHKGPCLVILSAKDGARLKESASRLRDYLESESDIHLGRLSYTLQVGREAMEERLAVVVSSADELLNELSAYVGGAPSPKLVLGRVEPHRRKKSSRQDERDRAKSSFDGGNLGTIALMWIEGQHIEWADFHAADRPYRLPLPPYPFAKERYWVSDVPHSDKRVSAKRETAGLHPLVFDNVSTLKEVCFTSSLSSTEYYARDHQVGGELFFPGAGFLEMACVAGTIAGEESVARLEDIVWMHPLPLTSADHPVKTYLKSNGNHVEYSIVSFDEDNERIVHSEGRVSYGRRKDVHDLQASYSIQELKSRAGKTVQGPDCYRQLEGFGLRYGPCFQTIQELYIGSDFALSRLKLAEELQDDFGQYILHPCIIDGALQTVIGITANGAPQAESDTPYLPFALGEVEILRPLSESSYALVERVASGCHSDVLQFDIQLLSDSGDVLARLHRFHVRRRQRSQRDDVDHLVLSD